MLTSDSTLLLYTTQHVLGPCKLLVYEYIPVTCDRDPYDLHNTSDNGTLPSTQILSQGSRLWYVTEMSSVRWTTGFPGGNRGAGPV